MYIPAIDQVALGLSTAITGYAAVPAMVYAGVGTAQKVVSCVQERFQGISDESKLMRKAGLENIVRGKRWLIQNRELFYVGLTGISVYNLLLNLNRPEDEGSSDPLFPRMSQERCFFNSSIPYKPVELEDSFSTGECVNFKYAMPRIGPGNSTGLISLKDLVLDSGFMQRLLKLLQRFSTIAVDNALRGRDAFDYISSAYHRTIAVAKTFFG